MATCTSCSSKLAYTTYIRTVRRGSTSHRSKQTYIPAGVVCLDCGAWQPTLDAAIVAQIRRRRSDAAKAPTDGASPNPRD